MAYEVEKISEIKTWNQHLQTQPVSHILQSWQWAKFKEQYGWEMTPTVLKHAGRTISANMVLKRSLSFGRVRTPLSILYSPRGPLTNWQSEEDRAHVFSYLEQTAKKQAAISIKIDPEIILGRGKPGSEDAQNDVSGMRAVGEMQARGWVLSAAQVQFRNTILLDLQPPEEELLGRMKQKTRYNIRLAGRKGVTVRQGSQEDLPQLYRMYLETSQRDGFVIRTREYYLTLWQRFLQEDLAQLLIAEFEGEILAGLIMFVFNRRAWYFYGMSSPKHRKKMPSYLLQWEAIRLAKRLGCSVYDFWGAPDQFNETDSMWGVYRFKEGFNGQVIRTPGAWDYAPRKALYAMFINILPRLLAVMRRRRTADTSRELEP